MIHLVAGDTWLILELLYKSYWLRVKYVDSWAANVECTKLRPAGGWLEGHINYLHVALFIVHLYWWRHHADSQMRETQ